MNGYSAKGFFYLFCIIVWVILTVVIREEFDPIIPTGFSVIEMLWENLTFGKVVVILSVLIAGLFCGLTELLVLVLLAALPFGFFLWLFYGTSAWIASAVGAGVIVLIVGGFLDFLWDEIERRNDDW